ncbi:hypothetical protein ACAG96_00565 [Candidatus Izemoplasma sp. B36]|uniref:hypothetical protein n=1 Tax=Candidatus Izemoplasma sp. B36 TaxID=3242468 RepID=UPI003557EAD8
MNRRYTVINNKEINKYNRIEAIVLNSFEPIFKEEIHHILPDISITTIELALRKLLDNNQIVKIGSYKDAKYIKK